MKIKVQRTKYKVQCTSLNHPIRHLNLAGNDFLFRVFHLLNHFRSNQIFVVIVHCIADAVFVESINVEARLKPSLDYVIDD